MNRLVVLLSDFGPGEYAGVMRGILAGYPTGLRWCDLTHEVAPQAVREGAWILRTSYAYFPEGAVFLAVVDPGVGTSRQAVAVRSRRYGFVGPDNGLLWPAIEDDGGPVEVVSLPVPKEASRTFHGRDVFAPAAARFAAGERLQELGRSTSLQHRLRFHLEGREGEVVRVDRFGNLVTNLPPVAGASAYSLALETGDRADAAEPSRLRWVVTYGEAAPGELVVVTGSTGTLELAVAAGRASDRLPAAQVGRRIRLEPTTEGGEPRA